MKKKIFFIINSISHGIKGKNVPQIILENLDLSKFTYEIAFTQYGGHASELAKEALASYDIVAAVGGDGTANEIGRALIHAPACLALIPVGSGNGLARHLKIPMGLRPSLQALSIAKPQFIDTGLMNGLSFLGTAGFGFDACIAHRFHSLKRRGFLSYCKTALRSYKSYHSKTYQLEIDGIKMEREAFLLTVANGSQYGNDFTIAPSADLQDGVLDLVILPPPTFLSLPLLLWHFKRGTLPRFHSFEKISFKNLILSSPDGQAHLDGEPIQLQSPIHINVKKASLKIMTLV